MVQPKPLPRLRLQGFNNLTKALSFNIYDVCYAASEDERRRYIEYIDEVYNADRLTQILTNVADIIGANILHVAVYRGEGNHSTVVLGVNTTNTGQLEADDKLRNYIISSMTYPIILAGVAVLKVDMADLQAAPANRMAM